MAYSIDLSGRVAFITGWKKLGQPVPDSNFALEANNGRSQQTQM